MNWVRVYERCRDKNPRGVSRTTQRYSIAPQRTYWSGVFVYSSRVHVSNGRVCASIARDVYIESEYVTVSGQKSEGGVKENTKKPVGI